MIKKPLFKKLVFLIFFILFGVLVPICYLSRPLFIDESVYLMIGAFVKNGALLYHDVAEVKPPGIFYLAALVFSVAGKSFIAVRVLTFVVNIASALLILKLGTKIKDKNVGMLASILFLVSVYLPSFQGHYYLAEPFTVFFILLSVLFFLKEGYRSRFIAGLLLGIGFLFKQETILLSGVFFLFYLLHLRFKSNRTKEYVINSVKNLTLIFLGCIVPFVLTFIYFLMMGVESEMLYYTIFYYMSDFESHYRVSLLIFGFFSYLPILLLSVSMVLYTGYSFLREKTMNKKHLFLVLWLLILSIPAITVFVDHRVLYALPPASLLSAILISNLYKISKRKQISNQVKCFIISTLLITTVIALGTNISLLNFGEDVNDQIRSVREIEQYVDGNVYTFTARPHVFFFSNLTPGVTYFGAVLSEEVAEEIIKDLQSNNVSYVIADKKRVEYFEEIEHLGYTEPNQLIYHYIQQHYQILTTTDYFIIYRSRRDT